MSDLHKCLAVGLVILAVGTGHVTQACCAIQHMRQANIDVAKALILPAANDSWHKRELLKYISGSKIHCIPSKWLEAASQGILASGHYSALNIFSRITALAMTYKDVVCHTDMLMKEASVDAWLIFAPFYINLNVCQSRINYFYISHIFAADLEPLYDLTKTLANMSRVHKIRMQACAIPRSFKICALGGRGKIACIPPLMNIPDAHYFIKHRINNLSPPNEGVRCLVYATSYGTEIQRIVLSHVAPRHKGKPVLFEFVGAGWAKYEHAIRSIGAKFLGSVTRAEFLARLSGSHLFLCTAGNEAIIEAEVLGVSTCACVASAHSLEQAANLAYYTRVGFCRKLDVHTDLLSEAVAKAPNLALWESIQGAGELLCKHIVEMCRQQAMCQTVGQENFS